MDQFWLTEQQTDAVSDWLTADHVWHFGHDSFSLLQQLCKVGRGIFYMADKNYFLLVN